MNKETVKQIRIVDYLATQGIFPQRKQGQSYWYVSPLREEKTASFKVNLCLNKWYDFGDDSKGDILDLVMALEQIPNLNDAIHWLIENSPHSFSFRGKEVLKGNSPQNRQLDTVSVRSLQHFALLQLLEQRKIPIDLAKSYCKEVHYGIKGKHYFAIGFPNNAGGYATLNPYFKGCIAPNAISSFTNNNTSALVFEGFMDFLSYVTIKQRPFSTNPPQDYHILNSVRNIEKLLPKLDSYEAIYCFLDNDASGKKALQKIKERQKNKTVIDQSIYYPKHKDLNDFLCAREERFEKQKTKNRTKRLHK